MSETAGGLYTEDLISMGVWIGERKQAVGSGAHYLHGNFYHWRKKKVFFSAAGTHRRPQRQHLSGALNNRAKESAVYLLIMYPLTLASTLQLHPL